MINNSPHGDFEQSKDFVEDFELLNMKNTLSPKSEAFKVIAVYVAVGFLWVLLSDNIIRSLVENPDYRSKIEVYKGWAYVMITGAVFYGIILRRLCMFQEVTNMAIGSYNELGSAYEELVAMESEISDQYDRIAMQKEELDRLNRKHQLIIQGVNDGIWEWELETGRYLFSDKDKQMLGYEGNSLDLNYEDWKRFIHPDDINGFENTLEKYRESAEGLYENTYRIVSLSGEIRWVLSRGKGEWDENGRLTRIAGSHTDITERVALEERLRSEKDFSENIIKESPVLIMILDNDLKVKRMNPIAEKMTGYFEKDALGKSAIDLFIVESRKKEMSEKIMGIANGRSGINKEFSILGKNGIEFSALWNANQVHGADGSVEGYIFIGVDISERRALEKKLNRLAYYDPLTDLPNRVLLEKHFSKMLGEADSNGKKIAFIYMDIDNFKNINDTMGHTMGDTFIASIADILSDIVKLPNMVGRLSGDEFAMLIFDVESESDIKQYTDEILSRFKQSWILDNQEFFLSTSMGVAMYPEHGRSIETLLQNSDTAMFHVKENGKDGVAIYRPDMRDKTWKHIFMSNHLRNAICNRELFMVYQPQVDLQTGELVGVEGLIRWIHPERGFISPGEFIPFAEQNGYIKEITDWTIEVACKQIDLWRKKGYDGFKVSINLSSKLINQPGMMEFIKEKIDEYDVDPVNFCLEITETAIIDSLERSIETLNEFRKIGVSVALDDFGTGYSSLTYLHKLPIDVLKVDREFLVDIVDANHESYIFESIMGLAHNMGLQVIAEGIETEGQANFLRKASCDLAQGYYFSKPISVKELEELLENRIKVE